MNTKTTILIPFDLIVDIDYAIIQEVKENYMETQYMNKELLERIDDNNIFSMLVGRKCVNIMELLLAEDYKGAAANLYKELIEEDYLALINKSCITNVTNLLDEYIKTDLVNINILCKNITEEQYIKNNIKKINVITSTIDKLDLSQYDGIFLKDIRDAKGLNTAGRTIYIGNYRFNYEEFSNENKGKVLPLVEYITNGTEIKSIDIYNINKKDKIQG